MSDTNYTSKSTTTIGIAVDLLKFRLNNKGAVNCGCCPLYKECSLKIGSDFNCESELTTYINQYKPEDLLEALL